MDYGSWKPLSKFYICLPLTLNFSFKGNSENSNKKCHIMYHVGSWSHGVMWWNIGKFTRQTEGVKPHTWTWLHERTGRSFIQFAYFSLFLNYSILYSLSDTWTPHMSWVTLKTWRGVAAAEEKAVPSSGWLTGVTTDNVGKHRGTQSLHPGWVTLTNPSAPLYEADQLLFSFITVS